MILIVMLLAASVNDHHLRKRRCLWHDERLLVCPDDSGWILLSISRDIISTFVMEVLGVVPSAEKLKIKFVQGAWEATDDYPHEQIRGLTKIEHIKGEIWKQHYDICITVGKRNHQICY